jgi:hypothetical protein
MQITGMNGRASVLRRVSDDLGMDGDEIVPDDDVIDQREQEAQMQQMMAAEQGEEGEGQPGAGDKPKPEQRVAQKGVGGGGPGGGGMPPPVKSSTMNAGPRTNLMGKQRGAQAAHYAKGGLVREMPAHSLGDPVTAMMAQVLRSMQAQSDAITKLAQASDNSGLVDAVGRLAEDVTRRMQRVADASDNRGLVNAVGRLAEDVTRRMENVGEAMMADTVAVRDAKGQLVASRKVRRRSGAVQE